MHTTSSTIAQLIAVTLAIGMVGCADSALEPVPVAGTVLIDGQPLARGTIRFVPKVGRPASSKIQADGSFDLAAESVDRPNVVGVPPGTYRVQVSSSNIIDDETIQWQAPQHYADFRTSGLEVVVAQPISDLFIELNSDKTEDKNSKAPPDSSVETESQEAAQ
jgi:hypothetical protein